MDDKYEITDKDIEVALKYLQFHDPKNATAEKAIAMLKDLRQGYHDMAHSNPTLLEELQRELDQDSPN